MVVYRAGIVGNHQRNRRARLLTGYVFLGYLITIVYSRSNGDIKHRPISSSLSATFQRGSSGTSGNRL